MFIHPCLNLPGNLGYEGACLQVQDGDAPCDARDGHHGVTHALTRIHARRVRRARSRQFEQLARMKNNINR
jgi:hypothetical protein